MLIQFQLNSLVSYPSQERNMESTLNSSEDSQQRNPNTCLCIGGPWTTSCPHVPQPAWAWGFLLRGPRIKTSTQFWLSHRKHWRIYVGNTSQIWVQSIPRTENYVGGKFLIYSKTISGNHTKSRCNSSFPFPALLIRWDVLSGLR